MPNLSPFDPKNNSDPADTSQSSAESLSLLKSTVARALQNYTNFSTKNTIQIFGWHFNFPSRHSETGRVRAANWVTELNKISDVTQLLEEIARYLSRNDNGNRHPHSFKTMLLHELLLSMSPQQELTHSLEESSQKYEDLLEKFKSINKIKTIEAPILDLLLPQINLKSLQITFTAASFLIDQLPPISQTILRAFVKNESERDISSIVNKLFSRCFPGDVKFRDFPGNLNSQDFTGNDFSLDADDLPQLAAVISSLALKLIGKRYLVSALLFENMSSGMKTRIENSASSDDIEIQYLSLLLIYEKIVESRLSVLEEKFVSGKFTVSEYNELEGLYLDRLCGTPAKFYLTEPTEAERTSTDDKINELKELIFSHSASNICRVSNISMDPGCFFTEQRMHITRTSIKKMVLETVNDLIHFYLTSNNVPMGRRNTQEMQDYFNDKSLVLSLCIKRYLSQADNHRSLVPKLENLMVGLKKQISDHALKLRFNPEDPQNNRRIFLYSLESLIPLVSPIQMQHTDAVVPTRLKYFINQTLYSTLPAAKKKYIIANSQQLRSLQKILEVTSEDLLRLDEPRLNILVKNIDALNLLLESTDVPLDGILSLSEHQLRALLENNEPVQVVKSTP